jgi:hypothetical protein
MVEQEKLFADPMPAHLIAAKADCEAISSNLKEVARILWPDEDPTKGQKRLSNALRGPLSGQLQKLDLDLYKAIANGALMTVGRSHLDEYWTKGRPLELKYLSQSECVERASMTLSAAAKSLQDSMSEAQRTLANVAEIISKFQGQHRPAGAQK